MKAYIPRFIHEQYKASNFAGEFLAYTMFVDISGFTPMTEKLMERGEEGAEVLSTILNTVFRPTVNAVYKRGGFITGFAGDGFTAVFPVNYERAGTSYTLDPNHVLFCSKKIQRVYKNHGLQTTKFGDFPLAVKIGISYGIVKWGIVGEDKKTFFFRGHAIDGCSEAEHQAHQGEILLEENILSQFDPQKIQLKKKNKRFHHLIKIGIRSLKKPTLPRNIRLRKDIVSQFLPQTVIKYSGIGEFRNVVSVFTSFKGITTREDLNMFATIVLKHIYHFSGYFKEIDFGDKGGVIVSYFGAPISFEDNISRALDFILAVTSELQNTPELSNLHIRSGITYGRVYSGFIGGRQRLQYSMLGDVVNLASRFMTKAAWDEIWVSENINNLEKINYDFVKLGEFEFKGKSGRIPVFKLLNKKYILRTTFEGKFVGREAEIEKAKSAFAPLNAHKFGGIIYIYGKAGVGKTRLIYELEEQEMEFTWIYLLCDGILQKPFNPFKHFLTRYFNQLPENTKEMNRNIFGNIYDGLIEDFQHARQNAPVEQSVLDDLESELIRLKPIIAGFLGCEYEDSLYQQLDAKGRYENTIYAFKEIIKALSILEPLVIQLEDLHWIDDDSVNAFTHICRNVANFPFIIISSSRYADDGHKPVLKTDAKSMEIDLNTLSRDGVTEFAKSLLGNKISDDFVDTIMQKTAGNPFFVEQTIFYYKETGIIDLTETEPIEWRIIKDQSVLPATINDLLIARIDRLSDEVKEVVQTAAVLGNEFEVNLLSSMLREDDFEEFVEEAENSAIWSALSELKYIFSHALLQDAVYHMQLKMRLRALHEFAAETIEKLFGDDENRLAELAFHYEQSENVDKAIEYLEKAGDYAKDNYHNTQALDFYDRLIPILEHELEELSQQEA